MRLFVKLIYNQFRLNNSNGGESVKMTLCSFSNFAFLLAACYVFVVIIFTVVSYFTPKNHDKATLIVDTFFLDKKSAKLKEI